MNKKYIKLFAVSALTFFASLSLVNAKTYTKLEDLVKDVETWREKENKENNEDLTDGYIYVVGNYVFTSNYSFKTLNDLADAWQSIPAGSKTYIYEIKRIYDEETYEPTGWDIKNATNLFKNGAKLPDLMNVYYLDKELTQNTVNSDDDVKLLVEKANAAVNNKENKAIYGAYELAYDEETRTITVNTKKNLALNSIKNSDVVATLYSILTKGTYSSIKINGTPINARTNVEAIKNALKTVLGDLERTHLVDLTKKEPIKVSFTPANGIKNVADVDGKLEYTIKFTAEVDTNSYFEIVNDSSNYALTCDKVEGELCTPVLNITNNAKYDGLRLIVYTVNKGLTVGSKKAIMTITSSTKTKEIEFTTTDTDANKKLINDAIKEFTEIKNYSDLEGLTISLKFEADTEKGYTFAGGETTVVYNFVIGSYIDLNSVIEKTTMPSTGNANLIISEDGKTINIAIPLTSNTFNQGALLNNFVGITKVLDAVKDSVGTNGKVTINGEVYEKAAGEGDASTANLKQILKKYIGVDDYGHMTIEMFMGLPEITVEITKDASSKFIPTATNVSGDKATYKVNLTFSNANLNTVESGLTFNVSNIVDAKYVSDEEDGNVLTVNLLDITKKVSDVEGTGLATLFVTHRPILKSVTINGVAIDFAAVADAKDPYNALKAEVLSKLNVSKDTSLKDLNGKTYTVKITLNDKVTPETDGKSELEFTLKFVSSAVVSLSDAASGKTLKDFVGSRSAAQIIYLDSNYVVPADETLEIEKEGLTIIGDGKSVITGNIEVKANNVTLDKVVVKGVARDGVTGKNTFVIDAKNQASFTLTNSTLSYDSSEDTHYAYGMIKVAGKVVITGNTIDITNVKNPIEFNTSAGHYATDGTEISGNHFTGSNYSINKADTDLSKARNVISIYGSDNANAKITIKGNTFDYANWAVRISNLSGNSAMYYITDNKVISNEAYTTDAKGNNYIVSDPQTAFVGIQTKNGSNTNSAAAVTINYKDNYVNGVLSEHDADNYNKAGVAGSSRFAYTDAELGKQASVVSVN